MMKGIFRGIICPLLALCTVAFTGCERLPDVSGTPVVFSAGTSNGTSQGKSRVSYGEISGTDSKSQEIDWVVGDKITVYCAQCEGAKSAEYVVTELHPDSYTTDNYARIGNVGDSNLMWGTGNHTFYSVYPGVTTTGVTASINGKDITGSIPAVQNFVGTVAGTDAKVASPNMDYMYMAAKNIIPAEEAGDPVFLEFKPLSTVLEFTITNKFDDTQRAMNVSSISLISAGHALSGGFAVDMDQTGRYGRGKTSLGAGTVAADCNTVTINFSTPVSVAYGKTLTFTFFLNPGNETEVNDLTFEIKGTNAGNSKDFTRRAKLEDKTHTGVSFPTHQKTIIKGLLVPEGVDWVINYDSIVVTSWDNEKEQNLDFEEQ